MSSHERHEDPMRTNEIIFVNESVTNMIVHPLISVTREIITLNESVVQILSNLNL